MDGTETRWRSLERWSPELFLVAGAILAVYATLNGLVAVTDVTVEPKAFEAGYVAGFLGLLGLYPTVARRSPWLARAGAVAAVLGAVAFSVFALNSLAELAGLTAGDPPGWSIFFVMAATGFLLGFVAFGVAYLRTDARSRILGLILLVPAVIIVLMFATIAAGIVSDGTVFVVSAGQAMTHLAIGATLRTEAESGDREEAESAPDATARG